MICEAKRSKRHANPGGCRFRGYLKSITPTNNLRRPSNCVKDDLLFCGMGIGTPSIFLSRNRVAAEFRP
jgi:hypothetical protein